MHIVHATDSSFFTTMPHNEQQKQRYDLTLTRLVALLAERNKDSSYTNEYKRFVFWAEENNLCVGDDYNYIHRNAVDRYFREAVVLRTCAKESIMRIVHSLQWFYDNFEMPGTLFVLKNPVVKEAIRQQVQNRSHMPSSNLGTDPHKGLKDILAEPDKKIILAHIHRSRQDWGDLSTSFSWGNNAGVRGASSRKFVLSDLYMSRGFGPERDGPRSRTLLLVLRQGDSHKDRFTTDRMVACWRHRSYELCSIFNTSMHVINMLRQDLAINFRHDDRAARASWWDTPLIKYENLGDETGPMKEVYAATGVEACKLTHNRTYAVQHAGSEGLAPYQINSLTKHMLEKFHKSYQAEVDKEACKVMAGFSKAEGYFVEREFVTLPLPIEQLIHLLLPLHDQWVSQSLSLRGDKSAAARKFLYEIIPYMVEVVVQDGIYLIRDFPEHEMSNYLKNNIAGYRTRSTTSIFTRASPSLVDLARSA
jgi:hypothetical protein